jgi:hypothetical protein
MFLSNFSVKKPVATIVLIVAIVAALFLAKPKQTVAWQQTGSVTTQPDAEPAGAPSK